jgi:predicted metal-binding membrane protein
MASFRRPAVGIRLITLLLVASLAAWLITIARMDGMDAGPGTDLGAVGWYVGVWVTMMAAMMLPSAAPAVVLFTQVGAPRSRRGPLETVAFVAGYLGTWTAVGLLAYGAYRVIVDVEDGVLAWDRAGPYIAGGAVAAAGVYQLTPLKSLCLRHCRSPFHFLLAHRRPGPLRAVQSGARHGAFCVGCCAGLMLVLFAVGVMSVFWMVCVAAVIFAEKLLPGGALLARAIAIALVAFGIWIAVAPGSVPGLTEPDKAAPMMG